MTLLRTLGTMSGTSMDGIDLAIVETDGEGLVRPGPTGFAPYDDADRQLLRQALAEATGIADRTARPQALAQAERMVTARHAEAIAGFLAENGVAHESVDIVGFHGQTVLHRPAERLTVQIGDGPALARSVGISVVHDFRADDVAAGGQGAPIVPAYHRALVATQRLPQPVALLNVGGVANVTWLDGEAEPVACDTGPGNALLDDLMLARTGQPIDRHGRTAACGRVDPVALDALMAHGFFSRPAPKSLDRNAFDSAPIAGLATEDAAATLVAFTAQSACRALHLLPRLPDLLVVCGGGARNPILVRELAQRAPCRVTTADALGWLSDFIEAQAFGYLAARSLRGLSLTFPRTTGVATPRTGGRVARI